MTLQTDAPLRRLTQADFRRERIGTIYALVDPRDRQIRYVGYTSVSLNERVRKHLTLARQRGGQRSYHTIHWLKSLVDAGLEPEIVALDTFVADRWQERERHWINVCRALGCNLTNTRPGGNSGGPNRVESPLKGRTLSDQHRARIAAATRRRFTDPGQRSKASRAALGKRLTEETKNKIRKHATHCPAGHEFTEQNTVFYRPGVKECRTCRREIGRAAAARLRDRRRAAGLTGDGKIPRRRQSD